MVAYCDATPARLQFRTRARSTQNGAPLAACPLMGQVVRAEAKATVPIPACLQSHVETRNSVMTQGKYPTLIRGYDLTWPDCFAALAARVQTALGDVMLRVEHVGSTALPGNTRTLSTIRSLARNLGRIPHVVFRSAHSKPRSAKASGISSAHACCPSGSFSRSDFCCWSRWSTAQP
jgi:GrpB protein